MGNNRNWHFSILIFAESKAIQQPSPSLIRSNGGTISPPPPGSLSPLPNKSPRPRSTRPKRQSTLPVSLGSDEEAVTWVNTCFLNVFTNRVTANALTKLWREALNEYNKSSGIEVSASFTMVIVGSHLVFTYAGGS